MLSLISTCTSMLSHMRRRIHVKSYEEEDTCQVSFPRVHLC
jgi:hypothetical protein